MRKIYSVLLLAFSISFLFQFSPIFAAENANAQLNVPRSGELSKGTEAGIKPTPIVSWLDAFLNRIANTWGVFISFIKRETPEQVQNRALEAIKSGIAGKSVEQITTDQRILLKIGNYVKKYHPADFAKEELSLEELNDILSSDAKNLAQAEKPAPLPGPAVSSGVILDLGDASAEEADYQKQLAGYNNLAAVKEWREYNQKLAAWEAGGKKGSAPAQPVKLPPPPPVPPPVSGCQLQDLDKLFSKDLIAQAKNLGQPVSQYFEDQLVQRLAAIFSEYNIAKNQGKPTAGAIENKIASQFKKRTITMEGSREKQVDVYCFDTSPSGAYGELVGQCLQAGFYINNFHNLKVVVRIKSYNPISGFVLSALSSSGDGFDNRILPSPRSSVSRTEGGGFGGNWAACYRGDANIKNIKFSVSAPLPVTFSEISDVNPASF